VDHSHLGTVMLLTGGLMVLVPVGIGVLIVGVVLHARRQRPPEAESDERR